MASAATTMMTSPDAISAESSGAGTLSGSTDSVALDDIVDEPLEKNLRTKTGHAKAAQIARCRSGTALWCPERDDFMIVGASRSP